MATNANQSTINGQIVAQIKVKLDEIAGITLEIRRMEKLTEALTKKVLGLEEQRKEVDVSREKIKASILVVEGEIEEQRKEREAEAKSIDELVRCLHSPTPPRPPGNDHHATTSYPHLSP